MEVLLDTGGILPKKSHGYDAGFDVYSAESVVVPPNDRATISTGFHCDIPKSMFALVLPRSGLAKKGVYPITGVIDSGYTGTICVTLENNSGDYIHVNVGDRIAQIVYLPLLDVWFEQVERLKETERGTNGFGSTGV